MTEHPARIGTSLRIKRPMHPFKAYAGAIALGLAIAGYAELGGPGIDSLQIASDSVMNWAGGSKPVETAPWRDLYGTHQVRLHRLDARLAALTGESLSLSALSAEITRGLGTDLEKIYAIHRWISLHIRYDEGDFLTRNFRNAASASITLERRAGVCDGIASLVVALGREAGLEVDKLVGEAKGASYRPGKVLQIKHAWNRVRIGNGWFLLDATWDLDSESGRPTAGSRSRPLRWFLVDPAVMIRTHLPHSSRWQLLTPPVNRAAFADS